MTSPACVCFVRACPHFFDGRVNSSNSSLPFPSLLLDQSATALSLCDPCSLHFVVMLSHIAGLFALLPSVLAVSHHPPPSTSPTLTVH